MIIFTGKEFSTHDHEICADQLRIMAMVRLVGTLYLILHLLYRWSSDTREAMDKEDMIEGWNYGEVV